MGSKPTIISKDSPLGIFDSGIGGLTITSAIKQKLPNESIIYFGDTRHLPYGNKSRDAIRYYSLEITKFLLDKGCKAIIIACNSASSTSSKTLQSFFSDKAYILNVIDPIVDQLSSTEYKKIGVIGTKATVKTKVYSEKIKQAIPDSNVIELAAPLLVPMIEEGFHNSVISREVIDCYLKEKSIQDIEALILACTHYPLIKKEIEDYYTGRDLQVLDANYAVSTHLENWLKEQDLMNDKRTKADHFYVSDLTESFAKTAKLFYGEDIILEEANIWN